MALFKYYFKILTTSGRHVILLFQFIITASKLCLYNFDPIFDAPECITLRNYKTTLPEYRRERADYAEVHYHKYFAIHVFVGIIVLLDSVRILAEHDSDYFNNRMPHLMTHLMYPEEYW